MPKGVMAVAMTKVVAGKRKVKAPRLSIAVVVFDSTPFFLFTFFYAVTTVGKVRANVKRT